MLLYSRTYSRTNLLSYRPPPSPPPSMCDDSCYHSFFVMDGDCDDGGDSSTYSVCPLGTGALVRVRTRVRPVGVLRLPRQVRWLGLGFGLDPSKHSVSPEHSCAAYPPDLPPAPSSSLHQCHHSSRSSPPPSSRPLHTLLRQIAPTVDLVCTPSRRRRRRRLRPSANSSWTWCSLIYTLVLVRVCLGAGACQITCTPCPCPCPCSMSMCIPCMPFMSMSMCIPTT